MAVLIPLAIVVLAGIAAPLLMIGLLTLIGWVKPS